jgi:hypothetical protein
MKHLVRMLNHRDRRTPAWLRIHVGDAEVTTAVQRCSGPAKPYFSAVCRCLGVSATQFDASSSGRPTATGEQSLTVIRQILTSRRGRHPSLARTRA